MTYCSGVIGLSSTKRCKTSKAVKVAKITFPVVLNKASTFPNTVFKFSYHYIL